MPKLNSPPQHRPWATFRPLCQTCLFSIALLPLTAASFSSIPTFDVNSFKQLQLMMEQVAAARQQLQQAQAQLSALTQSTGYGELLNHPALKSSLRAALPEQAESLLSEQPSHASPALAQATQTLMDEVHAPVNFSQDRMRLSERRLKIEATAKAQAQQSYNAMTRRLTVIDGLQSRINQTRNPKEIAELQARIGIEQANIQTDQTRTQLVQQQLQAERALLDARAEQVYAGWFGSPRKP